MNAKETQNILERHFNDCLKYWMKQANMTERKAFEMALFDIRNIKHNPFSPYGEELDTETKLKFIHYREMDLGRN